MNKLLAIACALALSACGTDVNFVRADGTKPVEREFNEDAALTTMLILTMGPVGEAVAAAEIGRPSVWSKNVLDPLADVFCANPRDAKTGDCQ